MLFTLFTFFILAGFLAFTPSRSEMLPLEHQHAFEGGRQFDAEFKYR